MSNIYVGNLSFTTTQQELESLFSEYGQVASVNIIRDRDTGQSRGFAFVEMAVDAEAERAIGALNGADLGGRALKVVEARPREDRGGGRSFGGGGRPPGRGGQRSGRPGGGGGRGRGPRW